MASWIAFLFTDIEGSTRLWEQHPAAMKTALAQHDAILRQAIEVNGGRVFKTMGDAFYAAFSGVPAALAAALAAQRALLAQAWAGIGTLRVRMAVHAGEAEAHDGDYAGPTLNRAARLLAAGHGGQILLSHAAQAQAQADLPAGARLHDLGEHYLKDLASPERIFQLAAADLPGDFPPLRSLAAFAHNLPVRLTSFVGRDKELGQVKQLLDDARLLTLWGIGGTGKTCLALQVAADQIDAYEDGIWFVDLSPLSEPVMVPRAVALALGVREEPGCPLSSTLAEYIRSKQLLLLLDNCEHLVQACADLVETLIQACPRLRVLATSREALGIAGETVFGVPPLSLPDPQQALPPEVLLRCEAVCLFVERAVAAQPAFRLTAGNAPAVTDICARLDGLPLAIELAAARVRSLSVEQIAARLDKRFRLLASGSRTALPRQQTLRALIDWSYDLLSGQERALLCRLSVFVGGWTLEAAEAICPDCAPVHAGDGIQALDVVDALAQLVNKSLVVFEEKDGEPRYRMLETIRQYAWEKLVEAGQVQVMRGRHLAFFLAWAEGAESRLWHAQQALWLNRLEVEHDNLRAALAWSVGQESSAGTQDGLRMAAALGQFWSVRGHWSEGRKWLDSLLSSAAPAGRTLARASALYQAGMLANWQGDRHAARVYCEESLAIGQEIGDKCAIAFALLGLGHVTYAQGSDQASQLVEDSLALFRDIGHQPGLAVSLGLFATIASTQGEADRALALYEENLALCKAMGHKLGIAGTLQSLATRALIQGEYARAGPLFEESVALYRECDDQAGLVFALSGAGEVARQAGDYAAAAALYEECLAIARKLRQTWRMAVQLHNLGHVACRQGQYEKARAYFEEGLSLARETERSGIRMSCLAGLAGILGYQGQARAAAQLLSAADAALRATGAALQAVDRAGYEHYLAVARAGLDETAFEAAWAEGQAMALEQAVAVALELLGEKRDSA